MEAIYSVSENKIDLMLYLLDGDTVVSETIVDLANPGSDVPLAVLNDYYTALKSHLVEETSKISEESLDSDFVELYNCLYKALPKLQNLSSVKVNKEQEKNVVKEVKLREEIVEAGAVAVDSKPVKETPLPAEEIL
jgi:hypothetical protein